ncbi:dihydrofolate reductase [Paenibacillus sp. FSL H8-0548]|uniref:dihydrofolate reductase n=1 Tax=Paenibacillus sp. FSL H8-0548 TaxID=1920422 RepID=UPI00096CB7A9|nr:dihydrofolate reductase [Paenibacillus sp. FSL H8-0548]OMF38301.1 dihydrofolate reductase [Paenibacillus sp. FSL H8-0548]
MSITLIAAMDLNRTIGIENKLPWRLPAEMAFFKQKTLGKTVLMGRKTFQSLPKPLKDRRNVVLTRQPDFKPEGCEIVHSLEAALELAKTEELVVIGGADIYAQFLPFADIIYLTEVEAHIEGGDAFFPVFSDLEWKLVETEHRDSDEKNAYAFTFQTFNRRIL